MSSRPTPLRVPDDPMRRLALYIRLAADALGLRDHEVTLGDEPAAPGNVAECIVTAKRQSIRLRVCEDFFLLSLERQRHAVVHELTHAHFAAVCATVEESIPAWMPSKTWEMFLATFEREIEGSVDAVATLLCSLVDPPRQDG